MEISNTGTGEYLNMTNTSRRPANFKFDPLIEMSDFINDVVFGKPSKPTVARSLKPLKRVYEERSEYSEDKDGNKSYDLYLVAPGFSKDEIDVAINSDRELVIKIQADQEGENSSYSTYKKFELDPKIYDLEEISAEMENGILKVSIPFLYQDDKFEPKKISIM